MTAEKNQTCNRVPFAADSSCSRGNVDILAFTGLPLCSIMNPTPAEFAIPRVDLPVVPFTPPPCACINIETSAAGAAEDRDDVYIKVGFKSIGDCCEGNYKADVDVKIPCMPFDVEGGSDSVPVDIDIESSCEPEGTFNLGVDAGECKLSFSPELNLKIPCIPFDIKGGADTVPADIDYDCEIPEPEGTFNLGLTTSGCNLSFNPELNLKIPKPTEYTFGTKLRIKHVSCNSSDCSSCLDSYPDNYSGENDGSFYIESYGDACGKDIVFHLNLKMPHVANTTVCKGTFNVDGSLGASGSMDMGVSSDDCGFATSVCPTINLNIPCPVKGSLSVSAALSWGNKSSDTVVIADKQDKCSLVPTPNALELQLPCPLENLELIGDTPDPDKPYVEVTKLESDPVTCSAKWKIHLVLPDYDSSSQSSSSESSSSGYSSFSDWSNTNSASYHSDASSGKSSISSSVLGSSSKSGGSSQGSSTGGGSSPEKIASFSCVKSVECSEDGGLKVITQTVAINFTAGTVTVTTDNDGGDGAGPDGPGGNTTRSSINAKTAMVRQLLTATVQAIVKDPSILAIVDRPGSVEANAALERLGVTEGRDEGLYADNDMLEDLV